MANTRKKKVVHIKETKAKVRFGTEWVTVKVSIPIAKIVAALGRRKHI